MKTRHFLLVVLFPCAVAAQDYGRPPAVLPPPATSALATSLKNAAAHAKHVWRDTAPTNPDGTVNGYIEIARGDRRKWEFDMRANARAIDRMIPEDIGGYPVNYGFVPQTVSYDGDPFDVLVLGPPLPDGRLVRGVIVGVMFMEDEKGLDSKVVMSPLGAERRPLYALTAGRAAGDRRLFHALQAARARRILEGAWLGIGGRGSRVRHDDPRVLPKLRQTCGNVVHRRKVKSSQLASSRRTRSRSRSI